MGTGTRNDGHRHRFPAGARQLVVAACVLLTAACAIAPGAQKAGAPRADAPDLAAIHDASSPAFDRACLGCHADVMTRPALDPKIKNAHAAMVPLMPDYDAKTGVTNANCVACHAKVDVVAHSGTQLRKTADVTVCQGCHGKNGPAKTFYAN